MTQLRITDVAALLGVSDDTARRMVDQGRLTGEHDGSGRLVVDGAEVAAVAVETARPAQIGPVAQSSERNRMRGLVTRVVKDTVMAQVELQCGPYRIVSLMSREAVDELGLDVGSIAEASIKSTNVVIGVPS